MERFLTIAIAVWGAVLSTVLFIMRVRSKRTYLRVGAGIYGQIGESGAKLPDVILISITNVGDTDALVKSLAIVKKGKPILRWFSRLFQISPNGGYVIPRVLPGDQLPKKIARGEEISLQLPLDVCCEEMRSRPISLKHHVYCVVDSLGRYHYTKDLARCFPGLDVSNPSGPRNGTAS